MCVELKQLSKLDVPVIVKLYLRMEPVQCISHNISDYKAYTANDGVLNKVFQNKRTMYTLFALCFSEKKNKK